jgi:hypothetical protein
LEGRLVPELDGEVLDEGEDLLAVLGIGPLTRYTARRALFLGVLV